MNTSVEIVKKLLEAEMKWESSIGGTTPGQGAMFRGHDMFEKFNHWNWLKMFYFSSTGKELSINSERFFNGIYCMCFSYPDPRIWNNGVAALAATARSTAQLAVCSASAVSEASFYGGPPVMKSLDFLLKAKALADSGKSLDEIVKNEKSKNEFIYGYGRPVVSRDERVKPAMALLKELDLFDRPYVQFALEIETQLKKKNKDIGLNIGGVFAAFCADEGMSANEVYYMMVVCFSVGMIACYIDSLEKEEGLFFPSQCSSIKYTGTETRHW
tara:strand:+ start:682 stop:1494 length:813 start_codon:yes stop_codon:yes gene_type:complete